MIAHVFIKDVNIQKVLKARQQAAQLTADLLPHAPQSSIFLASSKGKFMENNKFRFTSIDEYIATFPVEIQKILQELRTTIQAAAPDAEEKISYQMPTFFLKGNLVHFAAFKHHVGFYPAPQGIEAFKDDLSKYKGAKGSVQFPLDKPLPLKLINRIVKFRVVENLKKAGVKSGKRK